MKITVGGVVIQEKQPLIAQFNELLGSVEKEIEGKNRAIRRSKHIKKVLAFLGFIAPLGVATMAHAEELPLSDMPNDIMQEKGFFGVLASKLLKHGTTKATDYVKDNVGLGSVARKDSVIWHMNDWLQHALLHTSDFFDNAEVVQMFHTVWTICMSFVMIIISKKGFDMVKSKVLGTSTLGTTELIIRLLASAVMTFLSLDLMELGIKGSNLVIKTLFKALESNLVPYDVLEKTGGINVVFWFIGFAFMTIVLSIQYWVRQITIAILGILSPVANLSWVVDGGVMLGTLVREFILLISTPLIHGIVLTIGTIFIREVIPVTGNEWLDAFNIVMVGFSTMFLMITTPSFLRKFVTGTANPLKTVGSLGKGTLGTTTKLINMIRK
jgi:hypothetical protein